MSINQRHVFNHYFFIVLQNIILALLRCSSTTAPTWLAGNGGSGDGGCCIAALFICGNSERISAGSHVPPSSNKTEEGLPASRLILGEVSIMFIQRLKCGFW